MPIFEKIGGGYRIKLSPRDNLPNYNKSLPDIDTILNEGIKMTECKMLDIIGTSSDEWYKIYNECTAKFCCLNRTLPRGKFKRIQVIDDILTSPLLKDGCIVSIYEPGCMLTDLELLTKIKDTTITNFNIMHNYATRDYPTIIDEIILHYGSNTILLSEMLIKNDQRYQWALGVTARMLFLMGYAYNQQITLTYTAIRFLHDYAISPDHILPETPLIYVALDFYDDNVGAITTVNSQLLLLSAIIDNIDVILCRTNGIGSSEIVYTRVLLNNETLTPKMKSLASLWFNNDMSSLTQLETLQSTNTIFFDYEHISLATISNNYHNLVDTINTAIPETPISISRDMLVNSINSILSETPVSISHNCITEFLSTIFPGYENESLSNISISRDNFLDGMSHFFKM